MRTALSVLLTCWPPAPDARYVSIRKSLSLISISIVSSISGQTSTDAKLVCRFPFALNGEIRTSLCTPISFFNHPYARSPDIRYVMFFIPAVSPSCSSITSVVNPCRSAQRAYMRDIIWAQSCASVPPAPAWINKNAPFSSAGSRNSVINFALCAISPSFSIAPSTSASSGAISYNSRSVAYSDSM